jgi:hypothetical protein
MEAIDQFGLSASRPVCTASRPARSADSGVRSSWAA